MKIEMVLSLRKHQLNTFKTVIIKPVLKKGDGACGEVTKILEERSDGYFNCEVFVYPAYRDKVLKAFQGHNDKLLGK